jgi:hypothetical protein
MLLPFVRTWRPERSLKPGAWLYLLALPLGINEALLKPRFPETHNLVSDWYIVNHYLLLTLYGVGLASVRGPWDWFDAQRRVSLTAGACCSVAACSLAQVEASLGQARLDHACTSTAPATATIHGAQSPMLMLQSGGGSGPEDIRRSKLSTESNTSSGSRGLPCTLRRSTVASSPTFTRSSSGLVFDRQQVDGLDGVEVEILRSRPSGAWSRTAVD